VWFANNQSGLKWGQNSEMASVARDADGLWQSGACGTGCRTRIDRQRHAPRAPDRISNAERLSRHSLTCREPAAHHLR